MNKTSLYDQHVSLRAKMVPFAGFEMPIQYDSVKEEINSVRSTCGMFDVSHMGEFFIVGKDAIPAVDYLLSNNFMNSPVGKATYSPMLNYEGGVMDDLIAYKLSGEKVMLCVNAANIIKDYEWIAKNISKFDVTLENKSDNFSLIAVQGPKAYENLEKLNFLQSCNKIDTYEVFEKDSLIIARTGYTGEDGFEIFGPHLKIIQIWENLQQIGVKPCGLASRDTLRLEACYPLYGNELDESLSPYDCGLKWTVKMDTSDFIGKSALANAKPKYKLVKLLVEKGIPRQGAKILNDAGEIIGKITSGTFSPTIQRGISMGLIRNSNKVAEGDLLIEIRSKKYPASKINKNFLAK